jgi:hypothetical protein
MQAQIIEQNIIRLMHVQCWLFLIGIKNIFIKSIHWSQLLNFSLLELRMKLVQTVLQQYMKKEIFFKQTIIRLTKL